MKMCAQRKAGSPLPCEKRSAWGGGWHYITFHLTRRVTCFILETNLWHAAILPGIFSVTVLALTSASLYSRLRDMIARGVSFYAFRRVKEILRQTSRDWICGLATTIWTLQVINTFFTIFPSRRNFLPSINFFRNFPAVFLWDWCIQANYGQTTRRCAHEGRHRCCSTEACSG